MPPPVALADSEERGLKEGKRKQVKKTRPANLISL